MRPKEARQREQHRRPKVYGANGKKDQCGSGMATRESYGLRGGGGWGRGRIAHKSLCVVDGSLAFCQSFQAGYQLDLVDLLEGHTPSGSGEEWREDGQRNTWGETVNSTW